MTTASRAIDDMHLAMLARAIAGEQLNRISASLGKTERWAAITIGRIRDADLAESGEPPELVRAAYPASKSNHAKGKP